jgi:DNA-binding LytR/AlgR family response regulator
MLKTGLINNEINLEKYLNKNPDKIIIQDKEEIIFVKINEILFIESELKYTYIKTKKDSYKSRITMNTWEQRLQCSGFFRCHKSFLVNLNYVKKIFPMFGNTYIIKQEHSNIEIPISRFYLKKLKQYI